LQALQLFSIIFNQLNTFSYFKLYPMIDFDAAIILYQITEVKNNVQAVFPSLGN